MVWFYHEAHEGHEEKTKGISLAKTQSPPRTSKAFIDLKEIFFAGFASLREKHSFDFELLRVLRVLRGEKIFI
ncbi:hypothetical protein [Thioalkalivibrio denitrificans]|uniref:hypothetical protein n=1 Tax=Thioalkalivibrio denitrificans TaxID=108003 RepID=UPI0011154912|nr:hypothetical protein [Thioalkalivibrio denitrificans]